MGLGHSPSIVVDGLVFYIDPNNTNCYPGFGNTVYNLVNPSIGGTFVGYTSNPIDNTENRSIYFDGSNDYIQFPNAVSDTLQSFTLETVVKTTATNQKQAFMSTYASNLGWGIEVLDNTNSNKINFFGFTSAGVFTGVLSTVSVSTNTIYHLTAVYTASNSLALYVNGVFNNSVSTSFSSLSKSASANLRLGDDPDAQSVYFQGNMFLSKIYNRALSATEILQNYNATKKKYDPDENIVTNGLVLNIDPSKNSSYPGTGNTIYDLSGSGITGTLVNSPSFSSLNGGQINMPGSSKYIDLGQNFNFTSENFSVSFWIYLDSFDTINNAGQGPIPFFKGDYQQMGYYSQIDSNGSFGISTNQGGARQSSSTSAGILTTSAWNNLSCVRNGSSIRIYINGIDKTSATGTHINPSSSNQTFKINYYKGDYLISGQMRISQFLIYNRPLTQQEILQNYNATKNRFVNALPPVRNGLVLELDAGQRSSYSGTGNTWYDLSGNGLNGTLANGPTFAGIGATSSIVFDGSNDCVTLALNSKLDISESITIESFIYPTAYKTSGDFGSFIICKAASYYLELNGNGKVRVYFYSLSSEGYHESVGTVPLNTWSYISVVRNKAASTISIYINGILDRTLSSITGDIRVQQTYPVNLGSFQGSGYQLTGRIAVGTIYNRALSAYEVKQNFDFYRTRYNI
jgi:hypothetical protein